MRQVVCARCKRRRHCKFRQPGTWVVECEFFELEAGPTTFDAFGWPRDDAPRQGTGRPAPERAGLRAR